MTLLSCPVVGCDRNIRGGHIMCGRCYSTVSKTAKDTFWRARQLQGTVHATQYATARDLVVREAQSRFDLEKAQGANNRINDQLTGEITKQCLIAELDRELGFRVKVFTRQVAIGKMTESEKAIRIARMEHIKRFVEKEYPE